MMHLHHIHLHHIHLKRRFIVMSRYDHKAQIRWELKGLNEEIEYLKGDVASIRAQINQKYDIMNTMTGRDMASARASLFHEIEGLKRERDSINAALQERYARRKALKEALKSP